MKENIKKLKKEMRQFRKDQNELKKQIEVAYGRIVLLESSNTSR